MLDLVLFSCFVLMNDYFYLKQDIYAQRRIPGCSWKSGDFWVIAFFGKGFLRASESYEESLLCTRKHS